jgi:hypothetical protein
MALALDPYLDTHKNLLKNLIVVDIAPVKAGISPEFYGYVEAMQRIEKEKLKTRKEASDLLSNYEKVRRVNSFEPFTISVTWGVIEGSVNTCFFVNKSRDGNF